MHNALKMTGLLEPYHMSNHNIFYFDLWLEIHSMILNSPLETFRLNVTYDNHVILMLQDASCCRMPVLFIIFFLTKKKAE